MKQMSSNRFDITFRNKVHWKNLKGEGSYHSSCISFQLNIQLAMGTLASGIDSTNLIQLLSFLDIKNTKSLSLRFMRNMKKVLVTT